MSTSDGLIVIILFEPPLRPLAKFPIAGALRQHLHSLNLLFFMVEDISTAIWWRTYCRKLMLNRVACKVRIINYLHISKIIIKLINLAFWCQSMVNMITSD